MTSAGIGAGVQLGPIEFEVVAQLKSSVETLAKQVANLRAEERAYHEQGPVDAPLQASGTAPSSGSLWLNLGGPATLRAWILRRLIIGGSTWGTTVAGTANLYVSPSQPTGSSLAVQVDEASALPNKAFYTSRLIVLHAPNQLWVEIANPTSASVYVVSGAAEDILDRVYSKRVDL